MSGTAHYDFQALYNEIESVGAKIGFSSGTLTSAFSTHSLTEDLDLIMGLVAECLRHPNLPRKGIQPSKNANAHRSGDPRSGYSRHGIHAF